MLRHNLPERRKTARVYAQIPLTCEIIDKKNGSNKTKTFIADDINPAGIYFESDEVIPLNTEINISLKLPKTNALINAAVRVVRTETTDDEKKFGIGVVFIRLPDKNRNEIQQLLERLDIRKILEIAIQRQASDIHLVSAQPPVLRIQGTLEKLDMPKLDPIDIQELLFSIMSRQQKRRYEELKELDFGIQYDLESRFRINLHQQRGFMEATLRRIHTKVNSFEELNIPEAVKDLTRLKDGLVIISGPTGSGKTTTMAAMVQLLNQERKSVIITLERPIEYIHLNINSLIKQREIGVDTPSFSKALKSCLRLDPNVIVVGEIDDLETLKSALIAAESGYLVIVSLNAPNTVQTIDILTTFFPPESRKQFLSQLANCLKGVVTQLLVPTQDRKKRILASEILIINDAVKRVLRSDQLIQIPTIIQLGGTYKMQSMYDSIKKLLDSGIIDTEAANYYSGEFSKYGR